MQVGAGALLSLALPVAADPKPDRDMALILLFMEGGPSHLDTFDPKPDADPSIRGPFGAVPTTADGVRICDQLPRLARRMHRVMLLRGVSHGEGVHERARNLALTGRPVASDKTRLPFDVEFALSCEPRSEIHPWVCLYSKWRMSRDPRIRVHRHDLYKENMQQAMRLSAEPEALRAAYGDAAFGQNCLRARRLVERGARCVRVVLDGWDAHEDLFPIYRNRLLPTLDRGFSALLQDLADRGMLETTRVIWMGEFGRTPRINGNARPGRDHWPRAMTVALAGGGIQGGRVVGATDPQGMEPTAPLSIDQATSFALAALHHQTMDRAGQQNTP